MSNCPVCNNEADSKRDQDRDVYHIDCTRCGKFSLTDLAKRWLLQENCFSQRQKANISGFIYDNQNQEIGGPQEITNHNIEQLANLIPPTFHERSDKLLMAIEKDTEFIGQNVIEKPYWFSLTWSINQYELKEILNYLVRTEMIESISKDRDYKILSNGWTRLAELSKINPESEQVFVAMCFNDELDKIYFNCISKAIEDAGYKPHRVDQGEYTNKICDEIIAQIKQSRFVVADFTKQRRGVYFEAGYAKGMGLEVIWACRKDDLDNLHFDTRQYNHIDWENDKLDDFRKRLTNKIESVIGKGTYKAGGKDGD